MGGGCGGDSGSGYGGAGDAPAKELGNWVLGLRIGNEKEVGVVVFTFRHLEFLKVTFSPSSS